MAEVYRQKVADLHAELNRPELRARTTQALRIEEIRLAPENKRLEIAIAGDLAGIPGLAQNANSPPGVPAGCK